MKIVDLNYENIEEGNVRFKLERSVLIKSIESREIEEIRSMVLLLMN